MSERQARQKRKNEPIAEQKAKKSSPLFGCIAAILIIAFLGLGGYALKDNIKAILPQRPEKETTVADIAKDRDMSVEEFIAEFGLGDNEVTKKTTESELMSMFTVANYAKYNDQTVDELLADYEIKNADENMLWQDAYELMPMSKYAETIGMTFEDLKEQAGLPDEITEKMTLGEAEKVMEEHQAQETEDNNAEESAE